VIPADPAEGLPANLRIGTSSWTADGWVGPFYPEGTPPIRFLESYATRYDTVEVDATFYRIPSAKMVDGWRERSPEGFVFAAKVPRVITHDKALEDCEGDLAEFVEVMRRLGDRLGPLLLQFPYVAKRADAAEYETGDRFRERLERFLSGAPRDIRFAVEVRNEKWLRPPLLDLLKAHRACLVLVDYFTMPPIARLVNAIDPVTTDFLYVRFLGDHKKMDALVEADAKNTGAAPWSRLVVDRTASMRDWAAALRRLCPRVVSAYTFVNNHYAGYAPGSIDLLRSIFRMTAGPA
jgi:uncharacterized protein YecE (DUF72 family)